jgi:ABC-type antimicrobial peptide transport system permease subunit
MRRFFLKLFRRGGMHRDIQAELAFHREMSARYDNAISLGNAAVIGEHGYDLWRFNFFENLWRDIVYAARGLRRSPVHLRAGHRLDAMQRAVGALLMGSTGILGLLLASVGLYGVMAYSVARRTREIGVRIAIGAGRGDIARMVLRDAARVTVIGTAAGLLVALFVTKPLAMFLVPGLKPADPLNFAVVALAMLLTGLAATWGPIRRAINVDPNAILREE